jgi:hypothetical protein
VIICNGTDQGMERIATRVAPAAMLPQNLVTQVRYLDRSHALMLQGGLCTRLSCYTTSHATSHTTSHTSSYAIFHAPCSMLRAPYPIPHTPYPIPHTPYPIHIPYPVLVENTDECSPPMPSRHALSRPWHLSMPPALDNE